jgi:hypothetical protein
MGYMWTSTLYFLNFSGRATKKKDATVPYTHYESCGYMCQGLPPGLTLKKVGSYGKADCEKILAVREQVNFVSKCKKVYNAAITINI